mgnify:CR=1 FL=1
MRLKSQFSKTVSMRIRHTIRKLEQDSGYPDHTIQDCAEAYAYGLMIGALSKALSDYEKGLKQS